MEKTINKNKIYEGKIINLRVDDVLCDNGNKTKREIVEHRGGAAIALKDKNNKFILVKQYRYAQSQDTLEFVAGKIDPNENPLETIKREVIEETGYSAKNIKPLGMMFPSPGFLEERIFMYYGEIDEFKGQDLDENEDLSISRYSLSELVKMINEHKILDAKTIIMIYKLMFMKF